MKKLIIQLIKFGIVGVIATLIDLAVLMLLKEFMHVDVLVASAVAFSVSVIANYILSMLFVFVPIYNFVTRKIFLEKKAP